MSTYYKAVRPEGTDKGIRPYACSACGAPGYAKGLCERDLGRGRLADLPICTCHERTTR